jgi:hypothetical protein
VHLKTINRTSVELKPILAPEFSRTIALLIEPGLMPRILSLLTSVIKGSPISEKAPRVSGLQIQSRVIIIPGGFDSHLPPSIPLFAGLHGIGNLCITLQVVHLIIAGATNA